jgi:sRNA-binding carbon storage regulator CsrA
MNDIGNLSITLNVGEHVLIGKTIKVTCVTSDHRGARLYIQAPKSLSVIRSDANVKYPATATAVIEDIISTARASGQVEPKVGP